MRRKAPTIGETSTCSSVLPGTLTVPSLRLFVCGYVAIAVLSVVTSAAGVGRRRDARLGRGLGERLTQAFRGFEPVGVAGQDHAARALPIDLGLIDAGRHDSAITQAPGRVEHAPARADDHRVRRPQVLLSPIDDRSHALGDGLVLLVDACDAREALRTLGL